MSSESDDDHVPSEWDPHSASPSIMIPFEFALNLIWEIDCNQRERIWIFDVATEKKWRRDVIHLWCPNIFLALRISSSFLTPHLLICLNFVSRLLSFLIPFSFLPHHCYWCLHRTLSLPSVEEEEVYIPTTILFLSLDVCFWAPFDLSTLKRLASFHSTSLSVTNLFEKFVLKNLEMLSADKSNWSSELLLRMLSVDLHAWRDAWIWTGYTDDDVCSCWRPSWLLVILMESSFLTHLTASPFVRLPSKRVHQKHLVVKHVPPGLACQKNLETFLILDNIKFACWFSAVTSLQVFLSYFDLGSLESSALKHHVILLSHLPLPVLLMSSCGCWIMGVKMMKIRKDKEKKKIPLLSFTSRLFFHEKRMMLRYIFLWRKPTLLLKCHYLVLLRSKVSLGSFLRLAWHFSFRIVSYHTFFCSHPNGHLTLLLCIIIGIYWGNAAWGVLLLE